MQARASEHPKLQEFLEQASGHMVLQGACKTMESVKLVSACLLLGVAARALNLGHAFISPRLLSSPKQSELCSFGAKGPLCRAPCNLQEARLLPAASPPAFEQKKVY